MAKRIKRFQPERLEDRQMMAVDAAMFLPPPSDVVAFVSDDGTLHVREAIPGSANAVQISTVNERLRISGIFNADGQFTKINGVDSVEFAFFGDLKMELGGGSDLVGLVNVQLGTQNIVIDTAGPAGTANDDDLVAMVNVFSRNSVDINTGAGQDLVNVFDTGIGNDFDPDARLAIDTGFGADTVHVGDAFSFNDIRGNLHIKTFENASENDGDTVDVQLTTVHGNIAVDLGNGGDTLDMLRVTAGKNAVILAGDGVDTAELREVQVVDSLFARMGEGNDALELDYVRADGMFLAGDGGFDRLRMSFDSQARMVDLEGWEEINGKRKFGLHTGVVSDIYSGDRVATQF